MVNPGLFLVQRKIAAGREFDLSQPGQHDTVQAAALQQGTTRNSVVVGVVPMYDVRCTDVRAGGSR